jgi:hypothetical protein
MVTPMQNDEYSPELRALIEWARNYEPTAEEQEEHRRSFAYGNASLHNPSITREMVDRVADEMAEERGRAKE